MRLFKKRFTFDPAAVRVGDVLRWGHGASEVTATVTNLAEGVAGLDFGEGVSIKMTIASIAINQPRLLKRR
jgi:hypothetical protein